jgi:hypothetical protein
MMVSFPTSLDTLSNPGASTKTNDPGFELDEVISTLNDIAEALEAKVGIGASTPTASTVLRGTGTGISAYGQVATGDIAANAVTQSGAAALGSSSTASATYVNMDNTNAKVTLTTTGGNVLMWVCGSMVQSAGTDGVDAYIALQMDSGTDNEVSSLYNTAAQSRKPWSGVFLFTGVSAASHDFRVRWKSGDAARTVQAIAVQTVVMEIKR